MNGFNRVTIMGSLGKDAEVRTFDGGSRVATMQLAVNETFKDKQTGEKKPRTEWIRVEAWGGLADFLSNFGKKGTGFLVEGKLKTDSYEKDGKTTYSTKVVAEQILFTSTKSTTNEGAAPQQQMQQPTQQQPMMSAPQQPMQQQPMQQQPMMSAPQQPMQQPQQVAQQQVNNYAQPMQPTQTVSANEFMAGMSNDGGDDLPF
jgi:single-strand DNA-binding protein